MSLISCITCSTSIPETSQYCFHCGNKIKCSSCDTVFPKNAKFCINCGIAKTIIENTSSEKNTLKYNWSKDAISCEVSFTDAVGKEGIVGLIDNLTKRNSSYQLIEATKDLNLENSSNERSNEVLEVSEIGKNIKSSEPLNQNDFPDLHEIPLIVNYCTEQEWIAIYAFYISGFATKTFAREDVYNLYISKRKDKSNAKNFSVNWNSLFDKKYFAKLNEKESKFTGEKLSYLRDLISGKIHGSAKDKRIKKSNLKSSPSITDKKIAEKPQKTRKNSSANTYSLVSDLDLYPKNKENLKSFFTQNKPSKGPEILLLVVYYLEKILGKNDIDVNSLYTCYKEINIPIPNFKSSLDNINTRKGWINTSNHSNLKVTISGENHFEHVMKRK